MMRTHGAQAAQAPAGAAASLGSCASRLAGLVACRQPSKATRAQIARLAPPGAIAAAGSPGVLHTAPVQPAAVPAAAPALPAILSGAGHSPEQVAEAVEGQLALFPQALVQGVEPEAYAAVRKLLASSSVQYQARAKMLIVKAKPDDGGAAPRKARRLPGTLCVVSAGAADQAAADAVRLAAEHMGCYVLSKPQLSVANLPALLEQLPALQAADVVVVVAGQDAALPGAVAGMIESPVIALPTSSGAAAASLGGLGGLGSLVAAVSAAAPGVSVVGVDQAAAAAVSAARMLRAAAARVEKLAAANAGAAGAAAPQPAFALPHEVANGNGNGVANNVLPTLDGLALASALPVGVL